MNNTFYFLRHGHTKVDKNLPVSQWILSVRGEEEARKRAMEGIFDEVELVFSSTEKKAYQTAKPTADSLGKEVVQVEELSELDRDKGDFVTPEEYERRVNECLENPDKSVYNWEAANHAFERFSRKIEELDKKYQDKKILIVGHGFTINAYFAKLLGISDVYGRLNTNDFADWGVVKNKHVIKDIAK